VDGFKNGERDVRCDYR